MGAYLGATNAFLMRRVLRHIELRVQSVESSVPRRIIGFILGVSRTLGRE